MNTGSISVHDKLVQLGVRMWRGLYAVSELRWNGFSPKGDCFGLGVGLVIELSEARIFV